MNPPEKIKSGEKRNVIYSRFNALIDFVRSLDIKGDNRTIFLSKTPAGIIIRGKESAGGRSTGVGTASYEYSGYFKLYLIIETSGGTTTYKVRIADAATYQSESSVGGNSTCKVNGTTFSIAPYLSDALTASTLFYLKYDSESASVILDSQTSISMTLPDDEDTEAYYQLGRFYPGTTPFIVQDHSNVCVIVGTSTIPAVVANGIPQIWWVKNEC